MVPSAGFEPTTSGVESRCSFRAELQGVGRRPENRTPRSRIWSPTRRLGTLASVVERPEGVEPVSASLEGCYSPPSKPLGCLVAGRYSAPFFTALLSAVAAPVADQATRATLLYGTCTTDSSAGLLSPPHQTGEV
jgi:hypothetical protein